uniref:Uncharacterized protein n=1 Tax=Octactis speculum TaxID=3111310 RepID=A0A7S2GM88_9STRA|mmetsp:Transcript_51864/g.70717  ORF Transcript_51864/g.70717 Transcript_51864/m.70717 type:complete len:216 (+) Transcript_51864:1-648(+)
MKLRCFTSNRYEPYLLLEISPRVPKYDERYSGYGKNKIQFVAHLRKRSYEFFVIPGGFSVHVPHKVSKHKKAWMKEDSPHRSKMDAQFEAYLNLTKSMNVKTGLCDDKESTNTSKTYVAEGQLRPSTKDEIRQGNRAPISLRDDDRKSLLMKRLESNPKQMVAYLSNHIKKLPMGSKQRYKSVQFLKALEYQTRPGQKVDLSKLQHDLAKLGFSF